MLQNDALDDVGDVFGTVRGGLHRLQNVTPLHQLEGIRALFEQSSQATPEDHVRVVLVLVDGATEREQRGRILDLMQPRDRLLDVHHR